MPSTKYCWLGSAERLTKGRTASERMVFGSAARLASDHFKNVKAASARRTKKAPAAPYLRMCDGCQSGAAGGRSAEGGDGAMVARVSALPSAVSREMRRRSAR